MTDLRMTLAWCRRTFVTCGLVLFGIVGTMAYIGPRSFETVPSHIRSVGPTISQLERIGELTSMRIHVADVLVATGDGLRGSWLVRGDAVLSCDVSRATIVRVDAINRTATLSLPSPRVRFARLNHEQTKTWSVERTTWLPWSGGKQSTFQDAAMFHAEKLIEAAALSNFNLELARKQTELLVQQLYELVDWHVTVAWE